MAFKNLTEILRICAEAYGTGNIFDIITVVVDHEPDGFLHTLFI